MVTYNLYENLDDLDRRRQSALKDILFEGEEFVLAIDCKEGRIRSKTNTKLVLTDNRIIAFKKGIIKMASEDYNLDDISSIQFESGIMSSEIHLQGSGIDDEYPAAKKHGQRFVSAARKKMQD